MIVPVLLLLYFSPVLAGVQLAFVCSVVRIAFWGGVWLGCCVRFWFWHLVVRYS